MRILTSHPSANIKITPTVSETPPVQVRIFWGRLITYFDLETIQNTPAVPGTSIIPETPPPPSTPQVAIPATQPFDAAATAVSTCSTPITDMLSASPTPEFAPSPSVSRPPQITPIITTGGNSASSSSGSVTLSSGTSEVATTMTKARGPYPYK